MLCAPLPGTLLQFRQHLVLPPRCRRLKAATRKLILAWLLASACLTGHLGHLWHGAPQWVHTLGSPPVHATMSAAALLGEASVSRLPLHQNAGAWDSHSAVHQQLHSEPLHCTACKQASSRSRHLQQHPGSQAHCLSCCPTGPCDVQGLAGSSCLTAFTPGDGVLQT